MNVPTVVRNTLKEKGHTQAWVVAQMNKLFPDIPMSAGKFSAIVCGERKMQGDELVAFCKVTETDPEAFLSDSA